MKRAYKIDLRHQVKSFRKCFVTLAWTMGALILGPFVIRGMDYGTMFVICILFWLVTSVVMTLPFHLGYLSANWDTKLIVDDESNTIKLIQSGQAHDYKYSDIKVTRHILGHHRPDRTKSWTPIPFDYYGYLQIDTSDKKVAYLTSLMLDPFNPPLRVDKTEYRFPLIKRS
jgi:hypothetical protein